MKKNYILLNFIALLLSFSSLRVTAQCTTAASVPYFESFGGITTNNQLPLCWAASNMSNTCLTYTNNGFTLKCAAFFNNPAGDNYFYSSGINLVPGITYSVCIWYITDNTGGQNWTNLSLLLGPNQSTVGLTSLVSTPGAAASSFWKAFTTTFMVPTAGVYYVAIKGTGTSGSSPYLYWDELSVTAPCTAGNNRPALIMPSPLTMACIGSTIAMDASTLTINAHTYSWSNGSTSQTTTLTISGNGNMFLIATNTLTGCSSTLTFPVIGNLTPPVSINPLANQICKGQSANLMGSGAGAGGQYSWSSGTTGLVITVSPTVTTTYTVVGTNVNGCSASATVNVTVLPLPNITVSSSSETICTGQTTTITATGSSVYLCSWSTGTISFLSSISLSPTLSTSYSVTGTGTNGCAKTEMVAITVAECTGLLESVQDLHEIYLYPNPTKDIVTIETKNFNCDRIIVINVLGQVVLNYASDDPASINKIHITELKNGIYFLQLFDKNKLVSIQKIVKE